MSRPTYLYKEIVRIGRNGTEEEAQAELHNATRERQEWKKPLVSWQMAMGSISVSIWP